MSPDATIRLGLVAWRAVPAIFPQSGVAVGGIETGAWQLAKSLARHTSVRPLLVVRSNRPLPDREPEGVLVHGVADRIESVRNAVSQSIEWNARPRIKRWCWSLLWQVPFLVLSRPWRAAPLGPTSPDPRLPLSLADQWGVFGVSQESAQAIAAAREVGQPTILFLQSNADLDRRFRDDPAFVNEYGESTVAARFCLDHATVIVCQTQWQQQQLREWFDRDGVWIRNPIDIDAWQASIERTAAAGDNRPAGVLWVGRYDRFHKRPTLALEIARRCPEIQFHMVINAHDREVAAEIHRTAPTNVKLIPYVPFDQMPAMFARAQVFLSTSAASFEGFPNVLLQAVASGRPIVSLEDFDGFLRRSHAGNVTHGDLDAAVAKIRQLARLDGSIHFDPRAGAFLADHYRPETIAAQTARLCHSLRMADESTIDP
jgi:glycosyltransferase involved in cell wall biosynthesis